MSLDDATETKNESNDMRNQIPRYGIDTAIFFALFFLYVWLVIDPRLTDHAVGILTPYYVVSFTSGWSFFLTHVGSPGSLVDYAARFLMPYFAIGWIGALILTTAGVVMCWSIDAMIHATGRRRGVLWRLLPAALLLFLYGSYDQPLQTVLALLVSLVGFLIYLRAVPKDNRWRFLLLLTLTVAIYYVAGSGGLLFAMLAAIYELLIGRRKWLGLTALLCGLIMPIVLGVGLGGLSTTAAYGDFLVPFSNLKLWDWRVVLALYLYFPLVLIGIAVADLLSHRPGKRRRKQKRTAMDSSWATRAGRFLGAKETHWSMKLLAVCLAVGAVSWLTLNKQGKLALQGDYFCHQRMWPEALVAADSFPDHIYSTRRNRNILLALYHTGRLGDEMFRYPQAPDVNLYNARAAGEDCHSYLQEALFYLDVGQVNHAEKCVYEALSATGELPLILRQLAMINVIKERPETARVFLNALTKKPLQHRFAVEALRRLDEDPQGKNDPRVQHIRDWMLRADTASTAVDYEATLLSLLKQDPNNRMAFEFLMAHYLQSVRPDKVVASLDTLSRFEYSGIPRHFQEAILVHAHKTNKSPSKLGYELSPEVLERAGLFFEILERAPNDAQAKQMAIDLGLGDSYFFYYRFGESGI